jgi:aminotransferase
MPFNILKNGYIQMAEKLYINYIKEFGQPDIIHAHNFLYAGLIANYIKIKFNIKYIITEHSSSFVRNKLSDLKIKKINESAINALSVTAVSSAFQNILEKYTDSKIDLLPNIVDEFFFKSKFYLKKNNNKFIFLNIANLDENKNQEFLIKSLKKLVNTNQNVVLKIGGDGFLRNELENLVKSLGIKNQVEFLGRINQVQVREEMMNANCFVLPSNYETFGVVLIEALACGLPLIATKCGGPEDIVDDSNGLLIDTDNQKQLEKAMAYMYDNAIKYNREKLREDVMNKFGECSFVENVMKYYKLGLKNKICTKCVMDTTDTQIIFDENGTCNHCIEFDNLTSKKWYPNEVGSKKLEAIYEKMKIENASKDYDCILGLSGGVDSSYLALKLYEEGIRPLVVHVDGGWNSELAVQNIENIVNYCGWHLHTIVIDWQDMKDLQLAYLRSGISNQDAPQDHAYFSSLYHFSTKHGINYVISGGNLATESIFPASWHWSAMDADNLHAIHNKFGTKKLRNYKTIGFYGLYFYYPIIKKMKTIRPLNFMPYIKSEALEELKEKVGYKEYARKHGESLFTKFFQNYWLPMKFGYDKRKPHLSSLIVSGQMTREEALIEVGKPLYDEKELKDDKEYIAKKLGVSDAEFEKILQVRPHDYSDFSNMAKKYKRIKKVQSFVSKLLGRNISNYS